MQYNRTKNIYWILIQAREILNPWNLNFISDKTVIISNR